MHPACRTDAAASRSRRCRAAPLSICRPTSSSWHSLDPEDQPVAFKEPALPVTRWGTLK
jgi:hypothetical protein